MQFPKPIVGKITRGEVTLTVRPATGRDPKPADRHFVKAYKTSKEKHAVACHIIVVDIYELWAGEVTFKQALACGFKTTDDWKAAWVAQWDKPFMRTLLDVDDEQAREATIARFERRHAGRRARAIRFTLSVDEARFMADQRVSHGDGDGQYTRSPARAIDDLEVIDELTQRRYTEQARKHAEEKRASFQRDLEVARKERRKSRLEMFRRAA